MTNKTKVDWSQAPAWANYWAVDNNKYGPYWMECLPERLKKTWSAEGECAQAPMFDFQGDWKESLVKRDAPNGSE